MIKKDLMEPDKIYRVDDGQLEILKEKIEKLKSLAKRVGIEAPEIIIHKTEPLYSNIYSGYTKNRTGGRTEYFVKNIHSISISGKLPEIEGYKFIARIHHQPEGNFIFRNPQYRQELPKDLANLSQRCDLCQTNRDRTNTFVFIMEKEDEKLFPGKKPGDILVIGSSCVESFFLDGKLFIETINQYENLIRILDDFESSLEKEGEDNVGYPETFEAKVFLEFLIGTYLEYKQYISRSAAKSMSKTPTVDLAYDQMYPSKKLDPSILDSKYPVFYKLVVKPDQGFIESVEKMKQDFFNWLNSVNFEEIERQNPTHWEFFNNMRIISKKEFLTYRDIGFFGALFQLFLRDYQKRNSDKKTETSSNSVNISFEKYIGKKLTEVARENNLTDQAKNGWEVTVTSIKTFSRKYETMFLGNRRLPLKGYIVFMEDNFGNNFIWYPSKNPEGINMNDKLRIDAIIKSHEISSYSNKPETKLSYVTVLKNFGPSSTTSESVGFSSNGIDFPSMAKILM